MPALRYHPVVQRLKIRASELSRWAVGKFEKLKPWLRKMMHVLRPSELPTAAVGADGRYVLQSELARGTSGIVYRARDVRLDRTVALKQLFAHRRGEKETLQRFREQARVMARLSHPHIIQVYDFIEEAGDSWIAMELIEGESLERRLSGGALSVEETVRRGAEIADALGYAHSIGVVHGIFSPGNVLLDGKGRCKISDFGMSGPVESGAVPQSEKVPGSPAMMSPEQANGEEADARTDVYALGVTLFMMSTGALPFRGDFDSVRAQVLRQDPPAPRRLNGAIPEPLNGLILSMMAKRPSDRPQSMGQVKAVLQDIASQRKSRSA
jgi:serine/threonine-protein kinase